MRKLAFFAFLLVGLTACEKEEGGNTAERIAGTWRVDNLIRTTTISGRGPIESEEALNGDSLQLASDQRFRLRFHGNYQTGTWELVEKGSQLCLKNPAGTPTFLNITTLTPATLHLYMSERSAFGFVETTIRLSR